MLKVDYSERDTRAHLTWEAQHADAAWVPMLKRVAFDQSVEAALVGATHISLPWWSFAGARDQFLQVFIAHGLRPGAGLEVTPAAAELLLRSRRVADSYRDAATATPLDGTVLQQQLEEIGSGLHSSAELMEIRSCALPGLSG